MNLTEAYKEIVNENIPDNILYHGGAEPITKFDESKVQGGVRGIHGWGVYFSSSIYKAKDYGPVLTYLDSSRLKFLNTRDEVTEEFIMAVKNVGNKEENSLLSAFYSTITYELKKQIGKDIDTAYKNIGSKFNITFEKAWAELIVKLGFDGVVNGYEYVIMNLERGSQAIITQNTMNLSEVVKKNDRKHLFGCLMVSLPVNKESWGELLNQINPEHIYGKDGEFGREFEPHVTILFGLHDDIPDETIEKLISTFTSPKIMMSKITSFENDQFDVLKFDVDSPDLHKCHAQVCQLPNSDEFPQYHPHATIAYLQKGTAKGYHGKLSKPFVINPNQIKYSKADGTVKYYKIGH